MTDDEITTGRLAALLDVTPKTIADLAKGGIIERAGRGRWLIEASVRGYCQHLREQAAGRGGNAGADVRARLGAAQAQLTETRAKQLSGELVEVAEVESFWRSKLKAFRNRIAESGARSQRQTEREFDPRASWCARRSC